MACCLWMSGGTLDSSIFRPVPTEMPMVLTSTTATLKYTSSWTRPAYSGRRLVRDRKADSVTGRNLGMSPPTPCDRAIHETRQIPIGGRVGGLCVGRLLQELLAGVRDCEIG